MIEISGCFIFKNNQLLLLHKKKHDHWELPGGKIEGDESLEQTAKREAREEINCDVEITEYIDYFDFVLENKKIRSHGFIAKIISGTPKITEEDYDEVKYFSLEELNKINLAPNVKMFIEPIKTYLKPG